jgi:hypothetical protein
MTGWQTSAGGTSVTAHRLDTSPTREMVLKTSDPIIGYRQDMWIYTKTRTVIGYFDDEGKWIFSQSREPLGSLGCAR